MIACGHPGRTPREPLLHVRQESRSSLQIGFGDSDCDESSVSSGGDTRPVADPLATRVDRRSRPSSAFHRAGAATRAACRGLRARRAIADDLRVVILHAAEIAWAAPSTRTSIGSSARRAITRAVAQDMEDGNRDSQARYPFGAQVRSADCFRNGLVGGCALQEIAVVTAKLGARGSPGSIAFCRRNAMSGAFLSSSPDSAFRAGRTGQSGTLRGGSRDLAYVVVGSRTELQYRDASTVATSS
jgi:hypothetical protein